MKSSIRWVEHLAGLRMKINSYILVGKHEATNHFVSLGVDERIIFK